MMTQIRSRLGIKIFLSYIIVIVVGVLVLAVSTEFAIPGAFDRHLGDMQDMMMRNSSMMGMMGNLEEGIFSNFRAAVNEALLFATIAAVAAALVVSVFVSRRVVAPVRELMSASQHIASGHYEDRVNVPESGSFDELDELGQLALSFNRMAENLEQTETMRRQLIGDVTHELSTPLTTIKGSMEGLMDGVLPANQDTFQQVFREADRLQRLVDDLQELSRVEARAYELDLRPIRLGLLVNDVISHLQTQFQEKKVKLGANIHPDLPSVLVDEDRITQVLTNLIGNALQYTPEGGKVEVSAMSSGDDVHISIADTGIGIAAEDLPHLFTRFYRVEKSRSRAGGGSGIGLTIARHLVEAHGGRIWVESPGPGKGSTFTFAMPVQH